MNPEGMDEITSFLEHMKFKRKLVGGVDELDVLKKIEQLQKLYTSAYERRIAYDQGLLDEKEAVIRKLLHEKEK